MLLQTLKVILSSVLILGITTSQCLAIGQDFFTAFPSKVHQVVVVEPNVNSKHQAKLTAWQRTDQGWKESFEAMDTVIGRNGFAPLGEKREGDGRTPSGIYKFDFVFGYEKWVPTQMVYHQSQEDDIWIDDPHAVNYNRLTKISSVGSAKSFEHMKRADDLYKAGVVIEYNRDPVVAGYGSAIFLHIWRDKDTGSAGCVALSAEHVYKILRWLDSDQYPLIALNPQGKPIFHPRFLKEYYIKE